jgi:hypothetical protein
MPKSDRPLQVDIPRPSDEQPAWSKVGVIAVLGFVVGILWPRFAGFRVGPGVPVDARAAAMAEASAARAAASSAPSTPLAPSGAPSAAPSASASTGPAANEELVVVASGKTVKCYDKRDKKIEDCEKLAFDAIAAEKLRGLSTCPSALGLEGKMTIGFEFYFEKKEVKAERVKKGSSFPSSTEKGIVACANKEFSGVSIADIPHKHKRYTMHVPLTFYPPNKHPEGAGDDTDRDGSAGAGLEQADKPGKDAKEAASGTTTVAWDTAPLRKEPRDGDVVTRLVRGTRVKILSKQGDWLKVDANGKIGWISTSAVGP